MADKKKFALVSPKGEDYDTSIPAEATRLKAIGYKERAKKPAPKSDNK